MIELTTETLAGIECLHATPAGQRHQPLPTVLFYHGFTSSKRSTPTSLSRWLRRGSGR